MRAKEKEIQTFSLTPSLIRLAQNLFVFVALALSYVQSWRFCPARNVGQIRIARFLLELR